MQIKKKDKIKTFSIQIIGFICISSFINVHAQQVLEEKIFPIETSYLEPRRELEDYILDSGDTIDINFIGLPEFGGSYTVNPQGEINFTSIQDIKNIYVRNLTVSELENLLEKKLKDFFISPEIDIRISTFKPIRISITGEVRSPGLIKFDYLVVLPKTNIPNESTRNIGFNAYSSNINNVSKNISNNLNNNTLTNSLASPTIKRKSDLVSTISNAINKAGGLTSYSDISKIEIVRDIPLGKGGGKKRAIIDLTSYLNKGIATNDIRLFDGDSIFIPTLKERNKDLIPASVLSGLSPKFITVSIYGRIENPGTVKIPLEGSLSDAINLTGPRMPLAGKIFLVRYKKDGTLLRKHIKYSANASAGSSNNPYLKSGDLITVQNSIFGRTAGTIRAITEPFVGIYATKELADTIK